MKEWRLCKCLTCGTKFNQGTFQKLGLTKPHAHHHYDGDFCGQMTIINEPSMPLHWPLIEALAFYKWEREE